MAPKTLECVCVSLEVRNATGDPRWLVSLDVIDDLNRSASTKTLSVHSSKAAATEAATEEMERRGLPLYYRPANLLLVAKPARDPSTPQPSTW
jgi:hypothetical protein